MNRYADLPVSVDLPDVLATEVTTFVEIEAGWQVVGAGTALAPVLHLCREPRPDQACVVVWNGEPEPQARGEALAAGALDVVAWPTERDRLLEAPLRVRASAVARVAPPLVRVAAAGGGAGASTLALAIGALVAWRGGRAIVVGGDDLLVLAGAQPWTGPGARELAAFGPDAGTEVPGLTVAVPSVPGLALLGGGDAVTDVSGWPADVVVCDAGRSPTSATLVVARPDRSLMSVPDGARVIVNGNGAADRRALEQLLGRSPVGWLPSSARVARAGLAGRVPSGLPASWIAAVREAVRATI